MSAALIEHFERLAASLGGVAKLRELILSLAVRGKLVPQDPADEPASELLKKIRAEKDRLIAEGKIKRDKPLPPISESERPYELHEGWEWVQLAAVSKIVGGGTPKSDNPEYWTDQGIPWLTPADLYGLNAKLIGRGKRDISESGLSNSSTQLLPAGSVLFSSRAPIGYVAIAANALATNQGFKSCVPIIPGLGEFIYWFLKSAAREIDAAASGTTFKEVSGAEVARVLLPLPPLAEQSRIVAKVEELMALCDRLETEQGHAARVQEHWVEAALAQLAESTDADEFGRHWQHLAESFDTLFTTPESIARLDATLLQLAVRGKLVPQDPKDEPASELLKKIRAEKDKLIKEGRIKRDKALPAISDDEKPYELPEGWEWIQLGAISEFINGDRGTNYPNRNEYVSSGIPWINTGHIVPDGTLSQAEMHFITREKFDSLRGGKIQKGDLVYCLRGATLGKTAIIKQYEEGAIASSLMIIRPSSFVSRKYIFRYLTSHTGRAQIFRFDNGSAQPNLSANSVKLYVFPLPPLSEQSRIVAKVEELLALTASLKARLAAAQTKQTHLAEALIADALAC